jgi:hypothetical protein
MKDSMNITGKVEVHDYIAAQRLHMRPRKSMRIVLYCLLALMGLVYVFILRDMFWEEQYTSEFWILTLVFGYFIIYFGWFIPWKTRRLYAQHTALHKPFALEISHDYFHAKSDEGEAHTKWSEFHKWKEGKKLFLIYRADNLFHMIPKTCLGSSEDMTFFREVLLKNIGKEAT